MARTGGGGGHHRKNAEPPRFFLNVAMVAADGAVVGLALMMAPFRFVP